MIAQETIRAMARKIAERFHPERVVLFGSHARGEAAENSDIDLLVVMQNLPPRGRRSAPIILMLAQEYDLPVDVIVCSPESLEHGKDLPGSFPQRILKEGVVLYESGR